MILPNFICVGAQKSGTTTLHDILVQHPDIYLPEIKETKYFHKDEKYSKGLNFYYKEFFYGHKNEKRIGEIDPEYLYFRKVPERIAKDLGSDEKFIFIFRNPADRAYSHYLMSKKRGYEELSFNEAIDQEIDRLKVDEFHQNNFSYISRGYYAEQLERYLTLFPKKNMFFIIFELDFLENKEKTIQKLLDFLEVDSTVELNLNLQSNKSSDLRFPKIRNFLNKPSLAKSIIKIILFHDKLRGSVADGLRRFTFRFQKPVDKPRLTDEEKQMLIQKYFVQDIKRLEEQIDRKLDCWNE